MSGEPLALPIDGEPGKLLLALSRDQAIIDIVGGGEDSFHPYRNLDHTEACLPLEHSKEDQLPEGFAGQSPPVLSFKRSALTSARRKFTMLPAPPMRGMNVTQSGRKL